MFRASRPLSRFASRSSRPAVQLSLALPKTNHSLRPVARPALLQPIPQSLRRLRPFASSSDSTPPQKPLSSEHIKKVAKEKLKSRPEEVSTGSSVRHVVEPAPPTGQKPPQTSDGLQHDINIVKDTFRLSDVPRAPHTLGLAGTIPYLATSLSTVFLAWNLTKQVPTGNAIYDVICFNHDTAQHLLSVIEPVQLGYGAVIISFLGAVHWGLEFGEKEPLRERSRFRYSIGVVAPMAAWPTLFMPLEYALTTQFMAFLGLYFVDARAAMIGWAPAWYGTYRWLLTAVVGVAILISLVGRAKIGQSGRLTKEGLASSMSQAGIEDRSTNWAKLEQEEKERIKKEKKDIAEKKKQEEQSKQTDGKEGNKSKDKNEKKSKQKNNKEDKPNDDKTNNDEKINSDNGGDKSIDKESSKSKSGEGKEGSQTKKNDQKESKQENTEDDSQFKSDNEEEKDSGKRDDKRQDREQDSRKERKSSK